MTSDNEHSGLLIGELAQRTGTSPRSLRYYEQRGLLSSRRDWNGYRRFSNDAVHLVANLRRLLDSGLSVTDIQQFGSCVANPDMESSPCEPAVQVYEHRLRDLDDRIATLAQQRNVLASQTEELRARTQQIHNQSPTEVEDVGATSLTASCPTSS